jgi:hypothetical protein
MKKLLDILCIDFDETLFNNQKFDSWIDEELAKDGYMERGGYEEQVDSYHQRLTPILRLYDHEKHFRDLTGKEWAYIAGHLKTKLLTQSCLFCYPDAHYFIERSREAVEDLRILSFGHGEFQRFKMGLCRVLNLYDLPIHIVDRPKSEFILEHFSKYESGVLVDDKYPLDLPANFKHVLIDRKGKYKVDPNNEGSVVYVRNLDQYNPGGSR